MCTLTWVHTAELDSSNRRGYRIHFNRDESRQRSRALPPQLFSEPSPTTSIEFIAPIDQDAQGTWVLANGWGFSACLLNNYLDIKGLRGQRSRGLLVRDLNQVRDIDEALQILNQAGIENYSPFDLYLFDFKQVRAISWNGEKRADTENPEPFKSSSGFDTESVINGRKDQYLQNKDALPLRDFHRSHEPSKSAYSVCMHRDDACTQSYTEISVTHNQVTMHYSDGSPCEAPLSEPISMQLKG